EVLERHVTPTVLVVVEDGVSVAERAAPGVLAAQAHAEALEQHRADRQGLGTAPVDAVLGDHADAVLEQPGHLGMGVEVRRELRRFPQHVLDRSARYRGAGAPVAARPLEALPCAAEASLAVTDVLGAAARVGFAKLALDLALDRLTPGLVQHALRAQPRGVTARGRRLRRRLLVEPR